MSTQTKQPAAGGKKTASKSSARRHLTARVDKPVYGEFAKHAKKMTAAARREGILKRGDKAFSVGDVLSELGTRLPEAQTLVNLASWKTNQPKP